uniref:Uncharacterized protein n=1 Tax=Anguilla anguilla TaxID=7936 RepID=A0A0E9RIH6_ANGAN
MILNQIGQHRCVWIREQLIKRI